MENLESPIIIYDIGANRGSNIPYYLLKADKVIAVEANPALASLMKQSFAEEIRSGRLVVEECVVMADRQASEVSFYVNKHADVLSQLLPPNEEEADRFERITLRSKHVVDIISDHGHPSYVKIDIEHYDAVLLSALFAEGVYPDYISAELHSVDVFLQLASVGAYAAFKLVDGRTVADVYKALPVMNIHSQSTGLVSFPDHSAGPFGNDIPGAWLNISDFMNLIALEGMGWKDIHCSRVDLPSASQEVCWEHYLDRSVSFSSLLAYSSKRVRRAVLKRLATYF
jgi:FkbM family methyltransferase